MQIKLKFTATETRKSDAKGAYTYAKADLLKVDGTIRPVTVMAFGAQRDSVKGLIRKGRTVTLTAVFDGGVVKILGPARQAA